MIILRNEIPFCEGTKSIFLTMNPQRNLRVFRCSLFDTKHSPSFKKIAVLRYKKKNNLKREDSVLEDYFLLLHRMENQNQAYCTQPPKSRFWKFVAGFLTIIILAIAALAGIAKYERYLSSKEVDKMASALKQLEQQDYEAAMADTYGGKTPQETLSMYIAAVEKGDYALASKYFIGSKQGEELKSFEGAPKTNLDSYITVLKNVVSKDGEYSLDNKEFSFDGDILVRLKLYPNGTWKIIEISVTS